ncbi:MAG: hypothetical protein ACRD1Z_20250 [Vicinamibacteria bacterium]
MGDAWKNEERRRSRAEDKAREEFVPPASFEEAEKEVETLRVEIQKLEDSLRRHRAEAQGGSHSPAASREWRSKAKYALTRKIARLRLLKDWVNDERNRIRAGTIDGEGLDPRDPRSLVRSAFLLMREWARQRPRVTPQEWAVLNALENYALKR